MRFTNIIKIALLLTAPLCGAAVGQAQDNLSPAAKMMLLNYEQTEPASRSGETPKVLATIKLEGNRQKAIERLEAEGAEVVRQFGNFAIVTMPIDAARRVAATEGVKTVSFGETAEPMLVKARASANVDPVCAGTLTLNDEEKIPALKGNGVVTALYDTGFDTRHINFTDNDGNCRIKQFTLIKTNDAGQEPTVTVYDTPEEIFTFETDDSRKTHGTHVAGVMAGSYNGIGEAVTIADGENPRILTTKKVPYYGVATESEIVMSGGSMSMSAILIGVKDAIDYAKENGKPVVVNLSLGNNTGPHDGTSAYSEALAELGEEGIIVVAAGNEGEDNIALRAEVTQENPTVKSFFLVPEKEALDEYSQVWIMAPDATEVKGSLVIYDTILKNELARVELANNKWKGFGTGSTTQKELTNPSSFSSNFSGSIYGYYGFDEQSGKGRVILECPYLKSKGSKNVYIGIELTAPAGTKIYGYSDPEMPFASNSLPGWTAGTPNGSISDLACGENLISVGAYVTATKIPCLDKKGYYPYPYLLESIAPFSSYGELMNGATRPQIAAPGAVLISSYSTPYVSAKKIDTGTLQAEVSSQADVRMNYWGMMQGTSQATPMVSGIVALMLNADPTLKLDEVLSILQKTAAEDENTAVDPLRWGAGKIDASAAVKEVIARKSTGIEGITFGNGSDMEVSCNGGEYTVSVPGASAIEVTLTDITGQQAAHARSTTGTAIINCSELKAGIYILSAMTGNGCRHTQKIAIK